MGSLRTPVAHVDGRGSGRDLCRQGHWLVRGQPFTLVDDAVLPPQHRDDALLALERDRPPDQRPDGDEPGLVGGIVQRWGGGLRRTVRSRGTPTLTVTLSVSNIGRGGGGEGGPGGVTTPPPAAYGRSNTSLPLTPPPPCDIPSGCCSFTGPWTVTRSSLRMLRQVAAFCRPLRPVLLLVLFPRSRSPVVGVPGLCWRWPPGLEFWLGPRKVLP